MEPSDLRIGNLVNTKHGIKKIDAIGLTDCSSVIDGCKFSLRHFDYKNIEPIPLNEEWLLKFGFERSTEDNKMLIHSSTMLFELFNISSLQGGFKIIAGRKRDCLILQISNEIRYVHQLQNIYHSLTGQKLTIK